MKKIQCLDLCVRVCAGVCVRVCPKVMVREFACKSFVVCECDSRRESVTRILYVCAHMCVCK